MLDQKSTHLFYKALRETDLSIMESLVKKCLDGQVSPTDILHQGLIRAMEIIGQEFKAGKIWVPEVLLAARNMHAGIDLIRSQLIREKVPNKGKFLIGTVKGDIHDIGKNLVSMMLSGAGYQVIDLGIDVSRESFLKAIAEEQPDLVGLSALLTTTMLEMKEVIQCIRQTFSSPPKIIVGGAPVTRKFAEEIGADGYGEDATTAVLLSNQLLSEAKNR